MLQRLFKHKNLLLKNFDPFLLLKTSLFILLSSLLLNEDVSVFTFVFCVELGFFSFVVIKKISLRHSFLSKLLILIVNPSLNFLNFNLSILLCLQFKLFKLLFKLYFHVLFHLRLLDLNSVLFFLNGFFEVCGILFPSHKFKFILKLLSANILHFVKVFMELRYFDVGIIKLILRHLINSLNLSFVIILSLILDFVILLFKCSDFVFKLDYFVAGFFVFFSKSDDDILSVFELFLVFVLESVNLIMSKQIKYSNKR